MRFMQFVRLAVALGSSVLACNAHAQSGDVTGPVQRIQIEPNGRLWFAMDTVIDQITPFCKKGWYSFALYIPPEHPQYSHYFAMLSIAVAKGKSVYVANINRAGLNNGTAPCDITKTGYGLVLLQ